VGSHLASGGVPDPAQSQPAVHNEDVAAVFDEIADLLAIQRREHLSARGTVLQARRAWVTRRDVLNARPIDEIRTHLHGVGIYA